MEVDGENITAVLKPEMWRLHFCLKYFYLFFNTSGCLNQDVDFMCVSI